MFNVTAHEAKSGELRRILPRVTNTTPRQCCSPAGTQISHFTSTFVFV